MIRARIAVWLFGLTLLASCGGVPRTHYFVLSAAAVSADTPGTGSVGVAPFRVAPPYDGDRIVYRLGEHGPEVGFYPYHRWAAPLSRMLPTVVADTFGTSLDAEFEPKVPGVVYDAILSGQLFVIEELDRAQGPFVRVSLGLELRGPDGDELWSTRLAAEVEVGERDVVEVVRSMEQALASILAEAREPLGTVLATVAPWGPE
jgi:uncharacterized lipoprotein YmbA